jgi:hypothetical protein
MSDLDCILSLCTRIKWNISSANSVGIYDQVREIEQKVEKLKKDIELSVN